MQLPCLHQLWTPGRMPLLKTWSELASPRAGLAKRSQSQSYDMHKRVIIYAGSSFVTHSLSCMDHTSLCNVRKPFIHMHKFHRSVHGASIICFCADTCAVSTQYALTNKVSSRTNQYLVYVGI
ncbi:hypothetical protein ABBQ32_013134 [Trebouxia sp. C0010 RCD-2024]